MGYLRENKSEDFSTFPQTPLHDAAFIGSVGCVNALIQHGADVSAKNVRSTRVCESVQHRRRDVWGFVWFTEDVCLGVGVTLMQIEVRFTYLISHLSSRSFLFVLCSQTNILFFTREIHIFTEISRVCVLCVLLVSISQRILSFSSQNHDNCCVFSMISLQFSIINIFLSFRGYIQFHSNSSEIWERKKESKRERVCFERLESHKFIGIFWCDFAWFLRRYVLGEFERWNLKISLF